MRKKFRDSNIIFSEFCSRDLLKTSHKVITIRAKQKFSTNVYTPFSAPIPSLWYFVYACDMKCVHRTGGTGIAILQ